MTEMKRGLNYQPGADVEGLRRELEKERWLVFELPEGITDKRAFFQAVKDTLPLNPPLDSDHRWDALSDSLWEGLGESDHDRIAIIWPGSTTMAKGRWWWPGPREIARELLAAVADDLAGLEADVDEPKTLMVVLT